MLDPPERKEPSHVPRQQVVSGVEPGEVLVREATADDAPGAAELVSVLGYPSASSQLRRRLSSLVARPDAVVLVAEGGGRLVGLVFVHTMPSLHRDAEEGRLGALVVGAAERGRGIGVRLLRAAEGWLRARGAEACVVTSALRRVDAHRFYEREGYERTGLRFVRELGGLGADGSRPRAQLVLPQEEPGSPGGVP